MPTPEDRTQRLTRVVLSDLDNLLTVILGRGGQIADQLPRDNPLRRHAEEVLRAAQQAAAVSRHLPAWRRPAQTRKVDLNALIAATRPLVQRLLGEQIQLVVTAEPGLGGVLADPALLRELLADAALRARDAHPDGGVLTLETDLDAGAARLSLGGDAACVDAEFARRHGGSPAPDGQTIRFRLPLAKAGPASPRGTETILLVEEEGPVRALVRDALRDLGYAVLEARSSGEALLLGDQHIGPIHMLLVDAAMPEIDGLELAHRLHRQRAGLKVLYMTGGAHAVPGPVLEKPFTPEELAAAVRCTLSLPKAS